MDKYEKERDELNLFYEEMSGQRIFPFISPFKITLLKKGLYKKLKSNYYGITISKRPNADLFCYLAGYYFVPEDQIIIPKESSLTKREVEMIEKYSKLNYKATNKLNVTFFEFQEHSKEWDIANHFYLKYKNNGNVNN
jgi:hypothetical protein